MGAYLHIGFVAKATTKLPADISKSKLLKEIEDYYPNTAFDCTESDGKIKLSLKPEIIQAELLPFVRQVYEDFHGDPEEGWLKTALDFIREHAGESDWLEQAEEAELHDFSLNGYDMPEDFKIDGQSIRLYTSIVTLGTEGKFLMEECEKTLQFMETCAHRAYAGFQLGKAFRVFVL
ncbi:MAG: hypothetical protein WCR52_07780 [Bacteroidota bacterium]